MKKSWTVFWLAEAALLALCAAISILFNSVIPAGAFIILSGIWLLYYRRLEYTQKDSVLEISSGIVFRKHRTIAPENILWEMRLILPPFRSASMTVLHTSGGRVVILGGNLFSS